MANVCPGLKNQKESWFIMNDEKMREILKRVFGINTGLLALAINPSVVRNPELRAEVDLVGEVAFGFFDILGVKRPSNQEWISFFKLPDMDAMDLRCAEMVDKMLDELKASESE